MKINLQKMGTRHYAIELSTSFNFKSLGYQVAYLGSWEHPTSFLNEASRFTLEHANNLMAKVWKSFPYANIINLMD